MDSKIKFKLRKFIKELEKYRARHTELVSVYIPAGYDIVKITQQLSSEQGTARNIKSATTRKNVTDALEKMIRHLQIYKNTPEHGLAVFSGNISDKEGVSDVKVWAIEPPIPMKQRLYRCGQVFFLEPLKKMSTPKEGYGLIVMDRREANIAILKGKTIIPITSFNSSVPGKTRAGGQSAARFARVRENLAKDFFKKIGDAVNKEFADNKYIKGILLGGPGPTKEELQKGNFLKDSVKNKIIGIIDTGYTDESGLEEIVNKSENILANEDIMEEKKIVNKFFQLLSTKPKIVAYGKLQVEQAVDSGAVKTLLVSENLDDKYIEKLSEKVEENGGQWIVISKETREGIQLSDIGGLAAILRFIIN